VLYNLGMIASFLIHFLVVGMNQLRGADSQVDIFYRDYWSNGFPPADVWEFGRGARRHVERRPTGAGQTPSRATRSHDTTHGNALEIYSPQEFRCGRVEKRIELHARLGGIPRGTRWLATDPGN